MINNDSKLRALLLAIVLLLAVIAFRPGVPMVPTVYAQAAQFDHVTIVAPTFLYQGEQGILLLDKRNGNVWFMPRRSGSYSDPKFLIRLPFEELDQRPR
jgi:hypothetical protein